MTRRDVHRNASLARSIAGLSRYDLVLTVIPLAFVGSLAMAGALSIPVETAMAIASVVGALAVVDALFVNPPSTDGEPE